MERFIKKTFIFLIALSCIFAFNWAVNTLIIHYYELPLPKTRVLIAGDSHPEKSLDPSLFHSAANISQSGEPYILTYWKLRYIFKYFQPDTVILGFSYHNLSSFNDYKFSDDQWAGEMFRRSYLIGDFSALKGMTVDYPDLYKTYFRQMFLFPHGNHFTFIGHYSSGEESHISDIRYTIQRHYFRDGVPLAVSGRSISYLDSIIALCRSYNVRPILIGTPVRREYRTNVPARIIEQYKAEKLKFAAAGVQVLDMTNVFYDDSCYLDQDHLNEKGAALFTGKIVALMAAKAVPPIVVKASAP